MRGSVAKKIRRETSAQLTVKSTVEGKPYTKLEYDRLIEHKKRNHNNPIAEPKLKESRRQKRMHPSTVIPESAGVATKALGKSFKL